MALSEAWYVTKDGRRVKEGDPRAAYLLCGKGSTVTPGYPAIEEFPEAPPLNRDEQIALHRQMLQETVKRDELTPEEEAGIIKHVDSKMVSGPPQNKSLKQRG